MPNAQKVQQCIQHCIQTANALRTATNTVPDSAVRDMLTQGAHHIEMCIRGCEQVTGMAQMGQMR